MGILERLQGNKPVDNDAKKELIGEGVAKVNKIKLYSKEGEEEERIILEMEVIHPIEDKKGRETTLVFGDRPTKFYRESGGKRSSFEAFDNDMFTANISIDKTSKEALELSLQDAEGKLVYLNCWVSEFDGENGEKVRYQNVMIKNHKLITEENSTPVIPY